MKIRIPRDEHAFAIKYGISLSDVRDYENRNGITDVVDKYERQRHSAAVRKIKWHFKLDSWLKVWDGKIARRGRKHRDYCMCRHKDQGPYSPENVRIATGYENKLDWWERKPHWFKYQDDSRRSVSYGRTVDSD